MPKTVAEYVERLIVFLKIYKGQKVQDKLESTMPERKQMPVVGILTLKMHDLDRERDGKADGFIQGCCMDGRAARRVGKRRRFRT